MSIPDPSQKRFHDTPESPRTAAAQSLGAYDLAVFLLNHPVIGGCSCGDHADCRSPGKHPLHSGWQSESTTDAADIAALWRKQPGANIGVDTEKSRVVVIDSDPRHDGHRTLAQLEAELGPLPPTPTVLTSADSRGIVGRHHYFAAPDEPIPSSAGKVGDGVDVKAVGGLVAGAGSLHASGITYAWAPGLSPDDLPFLPLPDAWAQALRAAGAQPARTETSGIDVPGVGILSDQTIILKLTKTDRDATKYAALWRGEWSTYFSSQSEADLSLCSRIAFYAAGDADQIERVFGQSALADRPKWGKASYRNSTIMKAIAGLTGFYTGQAPTPIRASVTLTPVSDAISPDFAQHIAALEAVLAEKTARILQLEDERTAIMAVLGNQHLNPQERINYLLLTYATHSAKSRGALKDGMTKLYAPEIAARAGCSPQTFGKSVLRITTTYGAGKRDAPRELGETVDDETGEIITKDRTVLYAGVAGETVLASLQIGATLAPEQALARGGKRTKRRVAVPPCPDHPDAGTVTRCNKCPTVLATTLDLQLESPSPDGGAAGVYTTIDRHVESPVTPTEIYQYFNLKAQERDGRSADDDPPISPEAAAWILAHPAPLEAGNGLCSRCKTYTWIDPRDGGICRTCASWRPPAAPPDEIRRCPRHGNDYDPRVWHCSRCAEEANLAKAVAR